ncbi:MAG: phosphopantetheine-binding protein [Maricaulaceae bacterium]|jgi:acyl carrier protein
MSFKEKLVGYFKEKHAAEIGEDESLFERGVLDSMDLIELIAFIETNAGVQVPDDEVAPDNFETIAQIDALVARLQ